MITDFPSLRTVELSAATLFPVDRIPASDETLSREFLSQSVQEGLLLVATLQDTVVGCSASKREQGGIHLYELCVDLGHARQGIGRKLVEAVLTNAHDANVNRVTLTTFSDLPWNGPFYQSLGFRELTDGEVEPWLENILAGERAQGMTHRVAMEYLINP